MQQLLDAMNGAPAYVRNGRLDILGANHLARAVFAPVFRNTTGRPNLARFVFLDPAAQDFYRDWEQLAEDVVALLRGEAGRAEPGSPDEDALNLIASWAAATTMPQDHR